MPTPISEIGEFTLIDRMQDILGAADDADLLAGIRDDAAVYRIGSGRVHVLTTDALIETVHFNRTFMPTTHLGFKAMSVNVSDIVAMNARPKYALVTVGLPNNITVEMVESFYHGVRQACERYGVRVIGGDTTSARHLTVSVTVVGEAGEEDIVYRDGARPGDALCVTGDLGGAYAGLKVLLEQQRALREEAEEYEPDLDPFRYVIERQLAPKARLDILDMWKEAGIRPTSLIDISDGLASEVHHICRQSRCGATVYGAALPVALETRETANQFQEDVDTYALFGGEDYELLFTLPQEDVEKLDATTFVVVGEITREDGVQIQAATGEILNLEAAGFQHFGGNGTTSGE